MALNVCRNAVTIVPPKNVEKPLHRCGHVPSDDRHRIDRIVRQLQLLLGGAIGDRHELHAIRTPRPVLPVERALGQQQLRDPGPGRRKPDGSATTAGAHFEHRVQVPAVRHLGRCAHAVLQAHHCVSDATRRLSALGDKK